MCRWMRRVPLHRSVARAAWHPSEAPLSLQEVGGASLGRSRGLARGTKLLDLLDGIRHGFLTGTIPADRLSALLGAVKAERDHVADPRLAQILDEIERRAAVELAKLD